jgi:hypothetical protein
VILLDRARPIVSYAVERAKRRDAAGDAPAHRPDRSSMKHLTPLLPFLGLAVAVSGQSYVDLVDARNLPHPYSSMLMIEAGAIGTLATEDDPLALSVGIDDDISWDGRVHYRDETFSNKRGTLEFYAGRDGIVGSFTDGKLIGDDTLTRFEVRARPWQFYRDGFYRDDRFVPNGLYEGSDYEGYVGFGREAQQGLYVEVGPYYRTFDFSRSDLTPSPSLFTIPADYDAYGARLYLEQNGVQMDRRRGVPREGYMLTIIGEQEWNDSKGAFGSVGGSGFTTELPSSVWRLRGRLEWYIPSSDTMTWEIFAYGGWQDDKDRVENYQGQRPLGSQWADAQLRLRMHLGQSVTLAPFVHGQYSHVLEESGGSSDREFFLGGGAEAYVHFSDAISLHGWYSYLDNDNRPSIRIDEDLHGQQMFYLGVVLTFGASRR